MYRLKPGQECFTVVDGPDEGLTFVKGRTYEKVPAGEAHRFEKVPVSKTRKPQAAESTPDVKKGA